MSKKLTIIALAVLTMVIFAACGDGGEEWTEGTDININAEEIKYCPDGCPTGQECSDNECKVSTLAAEEDDSVEWYKSATIEKTTENIRKYNKSDKTVTEKPYDVYSVPGLQPRVVCQKPCSIPEIILKKKVAGSVMAIQKLVQFTGIDVLENLTPVDLHITSDHVCGNYAELLKKDGYVYRFAGGGDSVKGWHSYLCLWNWDDSNLVLPLNPKWTSQGQAEANAFSLEGQMVAVHEYAHVLFYRRSFSSPEDFVKALSFYISGIWTGNDLEFEKPESACEQRFKNSATSMFNLCTKCGFDLNDIGTLLKEIDKIYKAGKGEEIMGKVSIPQMKAIIDKITGKDSVNDCGVTWLGDKGNL